MSVQKEKKPEKKPFKEGGEKFFKAKADGATPGLAVFDYSSTHRLDARQFNEACKQMIDYAAINFGEVSKVLEFNQEVDFTHLEPVDPKPKVKAHARKAAELEVVKIDDKAPTLASLVSSSTASPTAQPTVILKMTAEDYLDEAEKLSDLNVAAQVALDIYKRGMQELEKIKRKYAEDKFKMYGVVFGQLTNAMRHRLQEEISFKAINDGKVLLDLWLLVRKVSLEERGTTVPNAFKRLDDARNIFGRIRQFAGESIGDFHDRFITESEAFIAAGGTFSNKDRELAMMFVQKLDRKRYGSILVDWENRLTDGQDVYPKTVAEALRRISSRRMDTGGAGIAGQGVAFVTQTGQQPNQAGFNGMKCFFCDKPGHKKKDCPLLQKAFQMFAEDAKKPKCDPANGKCAVTIGTGVETCDEGVGFVITNTDQEVTYSAAVLSNNECLESYDILCDNQSTVNLFKEAKLLKISELQLTR